MSSSRETGTSTDAAAIVELEVLEAARERLHDALREAAFSFVAAQREEEATRGCFVSYEAVPTEENTLCPLVTLSVKAEEERHAHDLLTSSEGVEASSWVLTEHPGQCKPMAPSRRASAKTAAEKEGNAEANTTNTTAPVDPIYYFSEHPSSALRECQAAYRRALLCVVEVAGAQQRAWAAAEACASASGLACE